jgi:hypothetical protein
MPILTIEAVVAWWEIYNKGMSAVLSPEDLFRKISIG